MQNFTPASLKATSWRLYKQEKDKIVTSTNMAGLKPAFFYLHEKIGTDKSLNVCKRLLLENFTSCHELDSASRSKNRCGLKNEDPLSAVKNRPSSPVQDHGPVLG